MCVSDVEVLKVQISLSTELSEQAGASVYRCVVWVQGL